MKLFYTTLLLFSAISVPALAATLTPVTTVDLGVGESMTDSTDASGTLDKLTLNAGASLTNSDFSDVTLSASSEGIYFASAKGSTTTVKNVNLSGLSYTGSESYPVWIGNNSPGAGYELAVVDQLDMSNSTFEISGTSDARFMHVYNSTLTNSNFDGMSVSLETGYIEYMFWFSSAKIDSCSFTNMDLQLSGTAPYNGVMVVSGNTSQWTTISNTSFQGTTVTRGDTSSLFDLSDILVSAGSGGSQAEIKNIVLGDGKIYSADIYTWQTTDNQTYLTDIDGNVTKAEEGVANKGILLNSVDDALTVNSGLYLDVSSTLSDGTLTFNGGTIELRDGAVLTIDCSKGLSIVINNDAYSGSGFVEGSEDQVTLSLLDVALMDAGDVTIDLSELILIDEAEGTQSGTIAVLDAEGNNLTGDDALAALQKQLVVYDADGNVVENVTLTDDYSYITNTAPEPSTATLSLLALAGLCSRRRRRKA